MDRLAQKLQEWVRKDPSPPRVALAATSYNWDGGMEFLHWALREYDVDKSAVLEIAFISEFSEFYGCKTENDVLDKLGEYFLDNWRLLQVIEEEWQKGKYRTQHFAPFGEVSHHFFSDTPSFKDARYKPEELPHFTILAEFPNLDMNRPKAHTKDLGEDGDQLVMLAC